MGYATRFQAPRENCERKGKVNECLILWISLYSTEGHLPVFNFFPTQH